MFPPSFDLEIYKTHIDIKKFSTYDLKNHYIECGEKEGRYCSEILSCKDLMKFIDLETCLELDSKTNFSLIKEKYNVVLNKFNLNKEKDLVSHFKKVYDIIEENGYYVIMIKDKRYTSDHFIPETDLLDILENYYSKKEENSLKKFIQSKCYQTHNDEIKHWRGNHGKIYSEDNNLLLKYTLEKYLENKDEVNNNYYFTQNSFKEIVNKLNYLELLDFNLDRLYSTVKNSNEFCLILKK